MRAYGAGRGSAASTAARGPAVFGIASRPIYLLECGVFNTTASAVAVALSKATAAGTTTGTVTEVSEDPEVTPVAVVTTGHSADATVTGPYVQASLGAAIGAGVIWTFGGKGLRVPAGTANGFVLTLPTGTGQIFDFYFVWDE
jgi:hypothetical protein